LLLVGALALVAGTRAACAAPLPDAIPVEVFAALPTIEDPKLSPDGTKVAGKIAVKGKQVLLVQPLFGGGKPAALAEGNADINWWNWVNDGWLVVGAGDDTTLYGDDYYATRVFGVSADMKTVKAVDPSHVGIQADDVIWYAQDGSPRILLSKETGIDDESQWYPSVFDVDVSTGRAKIVVILRTKSGTGEPTGRATCATESSGTTAGSAGSSTVDRKAASSSA
jgi:hypothetical protein